jgi:hypothetical protein
VVLFKGAVLHIRLKLSSSRLPLALVVTSRLVFVYLSTARSIIVPPPAGGIPSRIRGKTRKQNKTKKTNKKKERKKEKESSLHVVTYIPHNKF